MKLRKLNAFKYTLIDLLLIDFEMSTCDIKLIRFRINREKFSNNKFSISKFWVALLKSHFDVNIIVFVLSKAEPISSEHFSIWHAPVT
jgi:hypothetical protein